MLEGRIGGLKERLGELGFIARGGGEGGNAGDGMRGERGRPLPGREEGM